MKNSFFNNLNSSLVVLLVFGLLSCNSNQRVNDVDEKKSSPSHLIQIPENDSKHKPNIIFILADDLGYGDLSCYGQKKFKTPNIDALADQGILFRNFYAGSTVCAPSRSTIMTGQHTGHTTVRGNGLGKERIPLYENDTTIAMLLKEAGYKTAAIGKWSLGEEKSNSEPIFKGFDYWFGFLNQNRAHNYFPDFVFENDKIYPIPANIDGARKINIHEKFTDKSLKFIRDNKENPFFLYIAYTLPHAELVANEEVIKKFKGKYPEIAFEGSSSYPANNFPRATYAAMVHQLDADVGEIQKLIDSLGINENTLIVFTSDNGPEANGKHGCDPEFFNSTAGLRGVKRSLYEGGIRVPFIAKWEGKIKPGITSNTLGAMWDMLPTFCDIADVKPSQHIDGISLIPYFTNDSINYVNHEYLYWEFHRAGLESVLACRKGKWKALYYYGQDKMELFNLESDPYETNDISEQFAEVSAMLKQLMLDERKPSEFWHLSKEITYKKFMEDL